MIIFPLNLQIITITRTFIYLGSLITEDGDCTNEIRARLEKGKGIGSSLQKICMSHNIDITTKVRLMKA